MGRFENMIDQLSAWFAENRVRLESMGLRSALTLDPAERPKVSAWVDLENDRLMCRITVWESGECDVHIMGVHSHTDDIEHRELDPSGLKSVLAQTVEQLA